MIVQSKNLQTEFNLVEADFSIYLLVVIFFLTPLTQAQDSITEEIAWCTKVVADQARLACYDEIGRQLQIDQTEPSPPRHQNATKAVAVTPSPDIDESSLETMQETENQPAIDVENFGTPKARLIENSEGEDELIDHIVSLQEREPNKWLITLSSGQIWYQANSKRFELKEGMEVRIYPSPFRSSYRLSPTERKGFIQVKRIQ